MTRAVNQFIIDIVPLTRIPLTRNQSFSYLSDDNLSPGTLVNVPLFRRKVEGIVLGSKDDFKRVGGIELKKVEKVIEKNLLTEEQIKLAQFISEYYISPLGIVLKSFVPKRVRSRNTKRETRNAVQKKIILTKEQENTVNKIASRFLPRRQASTLHASQFLLFGPSGSGKTEVYIHSILKLREKNPDLQFLILVPEKTLTPQAMARYGAYFSSEETVLLSSNVSKGQYWSGWQKIASGEAKIVIGTRMAVFAPFKKLGMVIIDEEQDMSYKQWDMNPRYDARTVAEKLAEIHRAKIVRGSATPSIESYYQSQKKKYKLLTLSPYQGPNENRQIPDTVIVDMKKERWANSSRQQAGSYSSISKKLKAEIEYALKYKKQIVLFINRQGMSNFSVCTSCKTVLKCPKCDRALIYDKGGQYHCVHCNYKTSITPACSKCKGLAFQNVGLGTQKVEREINNIFSSALTARLDSQSIKTPHHQENVYRDFSQGKIDILIGTQMISKGWDLPKVALIGIIDADNLLSIPDYSSSQKAYELIVQTSGRTSRPGSKMRGTVIIQTFNPENKFIKWAAERNYASYFENEIKEREMLKLPPFGKIIKLVFQDMSQKKAEKAAKDIYERLEKLENTVSVSEPQEAYISKIRGRFRRQIVIRAEGEKMPSNLLKILKSLPPGWIIDVDPISIL